jgi:hypothetical protein
VITAWLILVSAILAIIWTLIQVGSHFDRDPKTKELRDQFGKWLSEQGGRTLTLTARLQETNQAFFDLFDRIFGATGSVIERSIWLGLLLSPVTLVGTRIPVMVGSEAPFKDAADSLLFAISLAFSVSLGVATSNRTFLAFSIANILGGISIGIGIALGNALALGIGIALALGGLALALGRLLGGALGNGVSAALGLGLGLGIALSNSLSIGIALGNGLSIGIAFGNTLGGTRTLGIGRVSQFVQSIHILVHPLRALAASLVFIVVVSIVVSLIRADVISSLLDTINQQGFRVLAFVAFNVFANTFSLLETRWVLRRGRSATVVQLLGLLALDLVASAGIFLFLPAVVGELNTFWDAVFLHGDRPWLGILFWSTFGTSVLFYLFVAAVFLFLLPEHALYAGFRTTLRVIGHFSTIEDRPFTSVAYAVTALCILLATAIGITALIVTFISKLQS